MSRIIRFLPLVALLIAPSMAQAAAPAAAPAPDTARFDTYSKADGNSYFALSLVPQTALPQAEAAEVVVLCQTSASEIAGYRDKELEVLTGLLATLGEQDRVKLIAFDVNAAPLTKSFVAPRGKEIDAAMAQLERRAPEGAPDIESALNAVAESFSGDSKMPRAVVFIGDGRSPGNSAALNPTKLIDRMADARISVHSFVVGPSQSVATLAALANQTGGVVAVDGEKIAGREVGSQLSRALHETVIWPTERHLPDGLTAVYPVKTPPLRADRDTVLVGKGSAAGAFQVSMKGQAAGRPIDLKWSVPAAKPSDDNAYLAQVVDSAESDGGHTLPALGSEGLWEMRRVVNDKAHNLAKLGRQAAAAGNKQQARTFVSAAMDIDPNNPNALVLKHALDQNITPASADVLPEAAEETGPRPGDLLNSTEQMERVIAQKVMTDATVELNRGRDTLMTDPASVQQDMKLLLERVLQVPELTAEQRTDLRSRISAMISEATRRRDAKEVADVERQENLAAARDRQRVLDNLFRQELQVKGLVDRFNSLMEQGYQHFDLLTNTYFIDAKLKAGDEIHRIYSDPYGRPEPVAMSAPLFASISGNLSDYLAVREAMQRNFLDVLHLIDVSGIPFPDEPPIVYPNAAYWRQLTDRRLKYKSVDLSSASPTEQRIRKSLDELTEMEFPETPLKDVMDYIKDRHHIEVQFDMKALNDANPKIDPSQTLITRTLKGVTLKSALKLILQDYNLTYVIKDEVLMITSKDEADKTLVTKVYPVGDLVTPIDAIGVGGQNGANGVQSGFGGGGGGGGGFGGGGGGFGGGGGGFGGGGAGGGGGGFFNIPDNAVVLPKADSRGAMDVADDLKVSGTKPESKSQSPAPTANATVAPAAARPAVDRRPAQPAALAKPTVAVEKIVVNTDIEPDKFWNDYFAALPTPEEKDAAEVAASRDATIRRAAKELMDAHKFNHVSALLKAALRNGFARPWMYEALALSLEADGQPKEEVERALMSAVDFANSPSDLMQIALYMSRLGLDSRAIKLLKQASGMDPFRHEPYMHGLQIAERIGDDDATRWACLGVLGQAWPASRKEVEDSARYAAAALQDKLRKEGKTAEAEDFKKALEAAQVRDCKVTVIWTGPADVDLTVGEPTGAVCSFHNPRTPGGGVMLGDSYAKADRMPAEGYSETYVLPQGFSGEYKLLIRRVWGQVATGKVTVDITRHYGTSEVRHDRHQIPLGERDALVPFTLADGRRKEALEQAQLAQAVADQTSISRAVLAQQIAPVDPTSSLSGAVSTVPGVNGGGVPIFPFTLRGAVGFQIVPTVLPEGTQLRAFAVISADRRYVRINAQPQFTSIPAVDTFNSFQ